MGKDARRNFTDRLEARRVHAASGLSIRDRLGRELVPGTLVAYQPPLPLILVVEEIQRSVNPHEPLGLVRLTLSGEVTLTGMDRVPFDAVLGVQWPSPDAPLAEEAPAPPLEESS